ncbi:MAG: hypothetical protein E7290_03110 [Lachnospiraceae bacterium]|nr:hypothetical protein [Lachnospiraceae bacterium]
MAGIGFELKKMFHKKGLLSLIKAYGYAGIVCVGPMLLGIALLLGVRLIASYAGADKDTTRLLNVMVTYTMLFSLLLTNIFSLVTTRYVADRIYAERMDLILPSFWGCVSLMLVLGESIYGVFLLFTGIPFLYQVLCLVFLAELIVVWTQINYLTAIKDYEGIIKVFILSVLLAWLTGLCLVECRVEIIPAMLIAICTGYGVMLVCYYYLMASFFPKGRKSSMLFIQWFDRYPELAFLGFAIEVGLFGHFMIMWGSQAGECVQGLFYEAPAYDISALLAFLSILITTINFVTSVEVNFYPKYRNYFSLYNDGGSLPDIEQAGKELKVVLVQELTYTFTKQVFATMVFIVGGTFLLPALPLGMNSDMLGLYRIMCVAYAFYAIGNCAMLIQLYFSDNKGALISGLSFMVVSCAGSFLSSRAEVRLYGLGFLAGALVFALVSLILLYLYMRRVIYHVLCNQPIVAKVRRTWITELSEYLQKQYEKKHPEENIRDIGEEDED